MKGTIVAVFSIDEIKQGAENGAAPYYFTPDTLAFFDGKVSDIVFPVPDGALFITSEDDGNGRRYSVRRFHEDDGDITTVGSFMEHETHTDAVDAAWEARTELS